MGKTDKAQRRTEIKLNELNQVKRPFLLMQMRTIRKAFAIIDRAINLQQELDPFLLESLGFKVTTRPGVKFTAIGPVAVQKIVKVEQIDDPTDTNAQLIEQMLQERAISALEGEIANPALEAKHLQETKELNALLADQLGPDFATSTAGVQALTELQKQQNLEIAESNRRDIESAIQLAQAQGSANTTDALRKIQGVSALTTDIPTTQSNILLAISQALGSPPVNQVELDKRLLADAIKADIGAAKSSSTLGDIGGILSAVGNTVSGLSLP